MINEQRLANLAKYAEAKICASVDPEPERSWHSGPVYRWQHTQRVAHYGRIIAEAEGANVELCVAGCLLHDTEWFDDGHDRGHGRKAAQAIRPLLEGFGYQPDEIDNICYSVAVHVDGNAGYEHEHTLEARVVSDADNIDRFGAYRILQWCVDDLGDYNKLADKLRKRVEKLEEYLVKEDIVETRTGCRMFHDQVKFQVEFFRRFLEEYKITAGFGSGVEA